jgi:hypothetical protein
MLCATCWWLRDKDEACGLRQLSAEPRFISKKIPSGIWGRKRVTYQYFGILQSNIIPQILHIHSSVVQDKSNQPIKGLKFDVASRNNK